MAETTLTQEEFEDMLEKLENGTERERLDASLFFMGRLLYYNGDWEENKETKRRINR